MMTIDEMRQHEWSVSWSGGKDSTATVIMMHELNIPIADITYVRMMYNDSIPATMPIMTEFVDKSKEIFESWGYQVNVIKSCKSAWDVANKIYKKSKFERMNGSPYGITQFARGRCKFQGVKEKTAKSIRQSEYEMIGICADEDKRIERLKGTKQSILVKLGITQKQAMQICKQNNLLSPLYESGLGRDGCFFCPNASKKEREKLKEEHPYHYQLIKDMIELCDYDISTYRNCNNWIADYFEEQEKANQYNLFDYEQMYVS